ncbi:MAG: hypothetical protein CMB56_004250 [Methanobacteriota archaeon]|nr:MAG: hypothetical protein CMB56_004250 [Euryarchaeota archaeon]|tara:strand:+ start:13821 stop:16958 length:3138 start_codon:yes stop_codon:yes gene_type:complete
MFSLPLGIEEKKGENPDLDVNSSEIDYGVINYFLPKTKKPCGYRLIAGGEIVGCLAKSGKGKNYLAAKEAVAELKKLSKKHNIRTLRYTWTQKEFSEVAILIPSAFYDLNSLSSLSSKVSIFDDFDSFQASSFIDSMCEKSSVLGALLSQKGMIIHTKGQLPGDIDDLATKIKSELDRSNKFIKKLELPLLNRISMFLEDGSLNILRIDDLDIIIWFTEGADHENILNEAISKLELRPSTNIDDDDGSLLEGGLKISERKGGLDNLISMFSKAKSDSTSGYIRVNGDEALDIIISRGIPVGIRSAKKLSISKAAVDSTAPKSKLTLFSLPKVERIKNHLNTIPKYDLGLFCEKISKARTRSKDREKQIFNRLLKLFSFSIGIDKLSSSLKEWNLKEKKTTVAKLMPKARSGRMLMPTSVVDSGEFNKIKKEQARLIRELARTQRQRDEIKSSKEAGNIEIDGMRVRISEMQQLNSNHVDEISQLKIELREATNSQELALSRNDGLTQRIKELENQVEKRIEELTQAVGESETREKLQNMVSNLSEQEIQLKSEIEASEIRLRQLRSSIDADDRRHRMISDQLESQRERQRQATTISNELERRIESQNKELEELEAESASHRKLIDDERSHFLDSERRLGHLHAEVRELMEERRRVMRELGDLGGRRAEAESEVNNLISSAESLKEAHDNALEDIKEAEIIRAKLRDEPLAQALLGHDHGFSSLAPIMQRLDRMRDLGFSLTLMDRAIERGLTIIQHNVDNVAKTPRYLLSNEVMNLLEAQTPETANTIRGLTNWSVRQRLENKLKEIVQLVVLDLESLLDEFERSTTLLRKMRQMITQLEELGVPKDTLYRLEALCNRPEALPHIANNLRETIQSALDSIFLEADEGDAGTAVIMEKTANSLDEALKQLDETGLTFGSRKPTALWRFQEDGFLPHEDVKLESERPIVSEEIIKELNPHNTSNPDNSDVNNEIINEEDGWTSMASITAENEEKNDIEDHIVKGNRVSIDAELAKLDHAWEKRNIKPEVDIDDPLNELNKELDNFDI